MLICWQFNYFYKVRNLYYKSAEESSSWQLQQSRVSSVTFLISPIQKLKAKCSMQSMLFVTTPYIICTVYKCKCVCVCSVSVGKTTNASRVLVLMGGNCFWHANNISIQVITSKCTKLSFSVPSPVYRSHFNVFCMHYKSKQMWKTTHISALICVCSWKQIQILVADVWVGGALSRGEEWSAVQGFRTNVYVYKHLRSSFDLKICL